MTLHQCRRQLLISRLKGSTISRRMHSNGVPAGQEPREAVIPMSTRIHGFKQDVWSVFSPLALELKAINLGQGFPSFNPPKIVLDGLQEAMTRPSGHQYTHPKGAPRLRKALAKHYSSEFKGAIGSRELDWDNEIVVTAGANEGIYATMAAFLNDGDEVICIEPFFDQYISNITMSGGKPVYVGLRPPAEAKNQNVGSSAWTLDLGELESAITGRTKAIIINTPHNPVGKMFSYEELEGIANICKKHNLLVLSDEVYDVLAFDSVQHVRMANLPGMWERTVTILSSGKAFASTGWRVGYVIASPYLAKAVLGAHTRIVFSCNTPCQEATAAGFEQAEADGYFARQIREYSERRKILMDVFDELELPYTRPQGAYFILVDMTRVVMPDNVAKDYAFPPMVRERARDWHLCYWMAKELGVVAIPPTEFCAREHDSQYENFVRFAFCKDTVILHEAARQLLKLRQFLRSA